MGRGYGEMGRLVLSGAVGAASRREVWGDEEMGRWGDEFFVSAPLPLEPILPNAQCPIHKINLSTE
jgi:hypothetical protein